jgi:hypothetical protein
MLTDDIFGNIFAELFGDNPLGGSARASGAKQETEKPKKTEKKTGSSFSPILALAQSIRKKTEEKPSKTISSGDKKKISRDLRKDKNVTISNLTSKRWLSRGSNGHYSDDDSKMTLNEYEGEQEVEIPSTAIADVKYDPSTRVCHVKYRGGNKWYRFINMSPQQFKAFMNASSKGRYVQFVMRKKNYDPSFRK